MERCATRLWEPSGVRRADLRCKTAAAPDGTQPCRLYRPCGRQPTNIRVTRRRRAPRPFIGSARTTQCKTEKYSRGQNAAQFVLDAGRSISADGSKEARFPIAPALWSLTIHAVLLGVFLAATSIVTLRVSAVFSDLRAELPPLTVTAIAIGNNVSRWWLLLFLALLAIDACVCLPLQCLAGPRARRWWSGTVILTIVLSAVLLAVAVGIPFASLVNTIVGPSPTTQPASSPSSRPVLP